MGLKCRVTYTANNRAVVEDELGQESKLYKGLLDLLGNQERALTAWAVANSEQMNFIGEDASVADVLRFMDTTQAEQSRLNDSEKFQVKDFMRKNSIENLSELYSKMVKIFKPNGIFQVDPEAALKSGLYTKENLENLDVSRVADILNKIEGQLYTEDFYVAPDTLEETYQNDNEITVFGTNVQYSEQDVFDSIRQSISNPRNEDSFYEDIGKTGFSELENKLKSNEKFAKDLISRMSKPENVMTLTEDVNGNIQIGQRNTFETVKNTVLRGESVIDIEADIEFIESVDDRLWVSNLDKVQEVVRDIEKSLIEHNLDIIGLNNMTSNKQEILEILNSARELLLDPSDTNIENFSELKDQIFGPEVFKRVYTIEDKFKDKTVFYLDTLKTETELFNNYGLIKIADNLYHKVDQTADSDLAVDIIAKSDLVLPKEYEVSDNPNPQISRVENVTNYIMATSPRSLEGINNPILYAAYLNYFDHGPSRVTKKQIANLTDVTTSQEYLEGEFVIDFYKEYLKHKFDNTQEYKTTLSKFQFSNSDINISGRIAGIENLPLSKELADYIRVKNKQDLMYLVEQRAEVSEDQMMLNDPESISEYQGQVSVRGDYVIVRDNLSDNYVKVNGELYRRVLSEDGIGVFLRVISPQQGVYLESGENFSHDIDAAQRVMDAYKQNSATVIDKTEYQSKVSRARVAKIVDPTLRELSTLTSNEYSFIVSGDGVVAYKAGEQVAELTVGKFENGVEISDFEINQWDRGQGVETEMHLLLLDNFKGQDVHLGKSEFTSASYIAKELGLKEEKGKFVRRAETIQTNDLAEIKDQAIANGTFMKAPNGNPTNLNEQQWLQTRTQDFKKWFGDWQSDPENASKVVDENGEPMVVYHGTADNFNTFKIELLGKSTGNFGWFGPGFYFATTEKIAKGYGMLAATNLNTIGLTKSEIALYKEATMGRKEGVDYFPIMEKVDALREEAKKKIRVIPAFLNIKNIQKTSLKEFGDNFNQDNTKEGVIAYDNKGDIYEIAVRESNQIKSATENTGEFSRDNNDIRFQIVGEKGAQKVEAYKNLLDKAKELEKNNVPLQDITDQTGWFKYKGDWRFFSNEALEQFKIDENAIKEGTEQKLSDILSTDNILFDMYPTLDEVKVIVSQDTNLSKNASYNEGRKTIKTNLFKGRELNSAIAHEVSHFIQQREGLPQGGNYDLLLQQLVNELDFVPRNTQLTLNEVKELLNENKTESNKSTVEAVLSLVDNNSNEAKYKVYRAIMGEMDAHMVTKAYSKRETPYTYLELLDEELMEQRLSDEDIIVIGSQGEVSFTPKGQATEVVQEVIAKLQETGLSTEVQQLDSEGLNRVLEELGVTEEVRKQVIAWHGTRKAIDSLSKETPSNKFGELLKGTYYGDIGVAAAFSGYTLFDGSFEQTSTVFKTKIDDTSFEVVDMENTVPRTDQELIDIIGKKRYNEILKKKKSGEIKGIKLLNAEEMLDGVRDNTQYVVFDNSIVEVIDTFRASAISKVAPRSDMSFQKQLTEKGVTLVTNGFVHEGKVYLNSDNLNVETPIHEFGHLYNSWLKETSPEKYNRGIELVKEELGKDSSEIQSAIDYVRETQPNLEGEKLYEEILTQVIGETGADIVNSKSNSDIAQWLRDVWSSIKDMLGLSEMTVEQVMNMNIGQYTQAIATDLLSGKPFKGKDGEANYQQVLEEINREDTTKKEEIKKTATIFQNAIEVLPLYSTNQITNIEQQIDNCG